MSGIKARKPKFIFITGGIVSGIGKGICAASIGLLLKSRGFSVLPIKIDPYLNKDAGTMNPFQHGEVFVTHDGAETDLDLGHYERFLNIEVDRSSNFTSGTVYEQVISLERKGNFLGKTIQIIPHLTDEIRLRIERPARAKKTDAAVVEIGGTVGDIEAEPFLEAARQTMRKYGSERVIFMHVVKMDYIFPSDEAKTKPIQQSVALLRQRGIQPDILIVRCKRGIGQSAIEKISLFTNVDESRIVQAPDAEDVYEIPLRFEAQGLGKRLTQRLNFPLRAPDLTEWRRFIKKARSARRKVIVGLVGKYIEHVDAYISVEEAVKHASAYIGTRPEITHIDAEGKDIESRLQRVDGVIVPGGFGRRGIDGKLTAIRFCREKNIPFLGLCLGLQAAVIEFSRNVCGLKGAHSTEFDPATPHPVIDILPEQKKISDLGGTMRLGASEIILDGASRAAALYGKQQVFERHRHRYELNPRYHDTLSKKGMIFSGFAAHDRRLVECIEIPSRKFFIATQAHPEFNSRPVRPHPLFIGFIKTALRRDLGITRVSRPKNEL
ncbi:MAG: CTP synthase [Parcubacteria group bacterium RIFCSPLOWO2_01_FULL_48_18]|nr:MAG: CTP synthase [Parcubacteria group bacterium RIFCSPLOWO2_01_FULL_48_18]